MKLFNFIERITEFPEFILRFICSSSRVILKRVYIVTSDTKNNILFLLGFCVFKKALVFYHPYKHREISAGVGKYFQVVNGTKNGNFSAVSQVEKLGLVGHQKFEELCLVAHLKVITHISVLFNNSNRFGTLTAYFRQASKSFSFKTSITISRVSDRWAFKPS